jgi:predicted RNase H-like HicB family nuclease
MIIYIELTRQTNNRYIARALQFPGVTVEAVSRDEALAQVREA